MARSRFVLTTSALALWAAFSSGAAHAGTVGSASLATLRNCASVTAADVCDGTGPGQAIADRRYAGGVGVAGVNNFQPAPGDKAYSHVSFGGFDLPVLRAATQATSNVRMNINAFGFQSYLIGGTGATPFSITGSLHVVDSSTNPGGSGLPGGAHLTGYVGIWDASILSGIGTDAQSLFNALFYAECGIAGVYGTGLVSTPLSGGEHTASITTTACGPGSLTFAPGTELLVVAGLQAPVNRGGFVDAMHTFTTELDPSLDDAVRANIVATTQSALARGAALVTVPEPASAALVAVGMLAVAARRRPRRWARRAATLAA